MTHYKAGDILVTAFPFVDAKAAKRRPVICVSCLTPKRGLVLYWVVMITSTEIKDWPGDIEIPDYKSVGLPIPSIVRTTKIACIDGSLIEKKVGSLDKATITKTLEIIKKNLS